MNRLGIQSLNAGAPDLRLSGDHTQRGTYTQRRRNQLAYGGIAGLDGRKAYGWGSKWLDFKDKIVDDIIHNEIKESPVGSALVGGALLNQFGLPSIPGLDTKGMGQNWLGELLGNVVPGGTIDLVAGQGGSGQTLGTGIGNIWNAITGTPTEYSTTRPSGIDAKTWDTLTSGGGIGRVFNPNDPIGYVKDLVTGGRQFDINDPIGYAKDLITQKVNEAMGTGTGTDASGRYPINWQGPLAIGTAIGAADYLTLSDDTMP